MVTRKVPVGLEHAFDLESVNDQMWIPTRRRAEDLFKPWQELTLCVSLKKSMKFDSFSRRLSMARNLLMRMTLRARIETHVWMWLRQEACSGVKSGGVLGAVSRAAAPTPLTPSSVSTNGGAPRFQLGRGGAYTDAASGQQHNPRARYRNFRRAMLVHQRLQCSTILVRNSSEPGQRISDQCNIVGTVSWQRGLEAGSISSHSGRTDSV